MLFSRKGMQDSRDSSRRFFADWILPKPYVSWADGMFSHNFTDLSKNRENTFVERRLAQSRSHCFLTGCTQISRSFSRRLHFPDPLYLLGLRHFFSQSHRFWGEERIFLRLTIGCFEQKKKAIQMRIAFFFCFCYMSISILCSLSRTHITSSSYSMLLSAILTAVSSKSSSS